MKVRCLLIDDEPPAIQILSNYISKINGFEVTAQCGNAIEALDILNQKTFDVIFLDIKMPTILGTEFIKHLANPPKIILVTAYRDFAIEGYELNVVDYLLKPVSFERFFRAIIKLNYQLGHQTQVPGKGNVQDTGAFVYLKIGKDMKKIFLNDVVYIESWKDYVKIIFTVGASLMARQSISAMESLLSEHRFLRVHRSYIVSLSKISGYNAFFVQLNEIEVPIGRLYKQQVLDKLQGA